MIGISDWFDPDMTLFYWEGATVIASRRPTDCVGRD